MGPDAIGTTVWANLVGDEAGEAKWSAHDPASQADDRSDGISQMPCGCRISTSASSRRRSNDPRPLRQSVRGLTILLVPIAAVPMVNASLWRHPSWEEHVRLLEAAGVVMLDPATGQRGAKPMQHGTGEEISRGFDPAKVLAVLAESVGRSNAEIARCL